MAGGSTDVIKLRTGMFSDNTNFGGTYSRHEDNDTGQQTSSRFGRLCCGITVSMDTITVAAWMLLGYHGSSMDALDDQWSVLLNAKPPAFTTYYPQAQKF